MTVPCLRQQRERAILSGRRHKPLFSVLFHGIGRNLVNVSVISSNDVTVHLLRGVT